jgi:hypothetical protein
MRMAMLACIVEHDVGLEVLECSLQRCLRSVVVLGITCACRQQCCNSSGRQAEVGCFARNKSDVHRRSHHGNLSAIDFQDVSDVYMLQMRARLHCRVVDVSIHPQ